MVIKSIRKLTRIRNNGGIQLQFFQRCNVGATGSKFVNGLHVFRELPLDALEVLMLLFIVFRNFLYFAQSRGSFDAIAFFWLHHDRACLSLILN